MGECKSDTSVVISQKKTLLALIGNSVGTRMFNSLFVCVPGNKKATDILNDGEFSNAFYVSSVLTLVKAIAKPTATVHKLQEDLLQHGDWILVDVKEIEPGDVIFYARNEGEDDTTVRVAFALSQKDAVSTSKTNRVVTKYLLAHKPIASVYRYDGWGR